MVHKTDSDSRRIWKNRKRFEEPGKENGGAKIWVIETKIIALLRSSRIFLIVQVVEETYGRTDSNENNRFRQVREKSEISDIMTRMI